MSENTSKLWYLGVIASLSGSFTVACAVQSVNSTGLPRILWTFFYIFGGIFFFETNKRAGEIMGVPKHYIDSLRIGSILILVCGTLGLIMTEFLLK